MVQRSDRDKLSDTGSNSMLNSVNELFLLRTKFVSWFRKIPHPLHPTDCVTSYNINGWACFLCQEYNNVFYKWLRSLYGKLEEIWNSYFWRLSAPHCDLDLEHRNPNVPHDTPCHGDIPAHQVSLRKVKWFRRYHLDNYSLKI